MCAVVKSLCAAVTWVDFFSCVSFGAERARWLGDFYFCFEEASDACDVPRGDAIFRFVGRLLFYIRIATCACNCGVIREL